MKFLISFITILFVFLPFFSSSISAQQDSLSGVISISPPVSYLKEGENYTLRIENGLTQATTFKLEVKGFEINENTLIQSEADVSNALELSDSEVRIESGETAGISVFYANKPTNGIIPGVLISEQSEEPGQVATTFSTTSIVYDPSLSAEQKDAILLGVSIIPKFSFYGTGFGNNFKVYSYIENNSEAILIPSKGEVAIEQDNIRLRTKSITQSLLESIYPGDSFENEFEDMHPNQQILPYQITATGSYNLNGESFEVSDSRWFVPESFVGIVGVGLLVVIGIGAFSFLTLKGTLISKRK